MAAPVAALLILLQCFGPYLHAHARGETGAGSGLHLHLSAVAPSAAQLLIELSLLRERELKLCRATPQEGVAVFLAAEYRRDYHPKVVLTTTCSFAMWRSVIAPSSNFRQYAGPAKVVAVPRFRTHILPPVNAPPLS